VRYTNIELYHVLKTQTLRELKQHVVDQMIDPHSTRLEQYPETRQKLGQISDLDRIRVWYGSRLMQSDGSTLKKNGISSGSVLTFEILPEPQKLSPNDTLLSVFACTRRTPSSSSSSSSSPSPSSSLSIPKDETETKEEETKKTAEIEIEDLGEILLKIDAPSLDDLKAVIARDLLPSSSLLGSKEPRDFAVAKYFFHKIRWEILRPTVVPEAPGSGGGGDSQEDDGNDNSKRARKQKQKQKKGLQNAANLRKNDCHLSSGDVLFVFASDLFDQQSVQELLLDSRIFKKVVRPAYGQDDSIIKAFGPHFSGHAGPRIEEAVEIDIGMID